MPSIKHEDCHSIEVFRRCSPDRKCSKASATLELSAHCQTGVSSLVIFPSHRDCFQGRGYAEGQRTEGQSTTKEASSKKKDGFVFICGL